MLSSSQAFLRTILVKYTFKDVIFNTAHFTDPFSLDKVTSESFPWFYFIPFTSSHSNGLIINWKFNFVSISYQMIKSIFWPSYSFSIFYFDSSFFFIHLQRDFDWRNVDRRWSYPLPSHILYMLRMTQYLQTQYDLIDLIISQVYCNIPHSN